MGPEERRGCEAGGVAFERGWIGALSYDLNAWSHASLALGAGEHAGWPVSIWHRFEEAYIHDHARGVWLRSRACVGSDQAGGGDGARRLPEVGELIRGMEEIEKENGRAYVVRGFAPAPGERQEYERIVGRALEYIAAGDVYQVNLAHPVRGTVADATGRGGSGGTREGGVRGHRRRARRLLADWLERSRAWYGAYVEDPMTGAVLASSSPELFLRVDASGGVVTRPMKGTRPLGARAGELEVSEKDRAELLMIVDLMRNDLGRVAETGSVRVTQARVLEKHGGENVGVLQGVASVSARLAAGVGLAELLGAVFPPGSVTGAPKLRAMQIIRELESFRRGAYCGCVGFLGDDGTARTSVTIRSAVITPRAGARGGGEGREEAPGEGVSDVEYAVGAGIVADSDPGAEWEETLAKAKGLSSLSEGA